MFFKTALFTVPVYKTVSSKHKEIKEYVMNNIFPEFIKNGPNDQDRYIYSSYFPNAAILDKEFLDTMYKKDVDDFMVKAGYNKLKSWNRKIKYWYNIGVKGSYQEYHDHINGPLPVSFVGVHHIEFDPNEHMGTVFYNPLQGYLKSMQPTTIEKFLPDDYRDIQKTLDVSEGDLIIFPAYVGHSVMTQHSIKPRITIALNISIYED